MDAAARISLDALINKTRPPETGMERHFVRVMEGEAMPCTDEEREWFRYWRRESPSEKTATCHRCIELSEDLQRTYEQMSGLTVALDFARKELERISRLREIEVSQALTNASDLQRERNYLFNLSESRLQRIDKLLLALNRAGVLDPDATPTPVLDKSEGIGRGWTGDGNDWRDRDQ